MGRGIVENVDEMDGEPWSPELLDWLTSDFVDGGYDLKGLIGTIIQSRTFRDFEVYILVAAAYLALAMIFRLLFAGLYQIVFARR